MEQSAPASSVAAATAPRVQGTNSAEKQASDLGETAIDALAGSETAQELADSMKRCEKLLVDWGRLVAQLLSALVIGLGIRGRSTTIS